MFTAEQIGPLDDGATFGNTSPGTKGVDWPGETDDVDVAGFALTQGTSTGLGSLTDSSVGGTGSLTLDEGGTFTCPSVVECPIIVPNAVTALLDFGDGITDGGCQYSGSVIAITCEIGGTVTDVLGNVENSGVGAGFTNYSGTVTDFSGSMENSGAGIGIDNDGDMTDFSGALLNTDVGTGFNNTYNVADFSGTLTNSGAGSGLSNYGTVTDVSGTVLDSGSGIAFYGPFGGTLQNITGLIGRPSSQVDLLAENILLGKTILGVAGELSGGGGRIIGG